ncbi:MAG: hypothetical protein WD749_01950 [Phycisphaerales bacterium]
MPEAGPELTDQSEGGAAGGAGGAAFGWACFLASSWTWCIGMFLPVLLFRDFGAWSFAAFAVPNVVGAAAMGVGLRSAGASRGLIARHSAACGAFSLVARAFQFFFLVWVLLNTPGRGAGLLVLAAFLVGLILGSRAYAGSALRGARLGGAGALLISVALLAAFGVLGGLRLPPEAVGAAGAGPARDLLWLAPVMAFGFAFCPWLDLTFHHARQSAPGWAGDRAFVLGFGVLFAGMIGATFLYAWVFLDPAGELSFAGLGGAAMALLLCHMGVQLGFTTELHRARVDRAGAAPRVVHARGIDWSALGIAAGVLTAFLPPVAGLTGGEVLYRLFMAFYGLVFPAYVWVCVIPARGGSEEAAGPTARSLVLWGAAVAVAAPMFWMGFVEREAWWLGPGLGAVLLARVPLMVGGAGPRA